jgi:hypothetical protein
MIYTSYDMVRDCRAGAVRGWTHFVTHYTPIVRRVVAHYRPEQSVDQATARVLAAIHGDGALFRAIEPVAERVFVTALRQHVLALLERDEHSIAPEVALDPTEVLESLAPLTVVEKQAVWLDAMRYDEETTARMLRMDARTAGRIRERAAELMRTRFDRWSRDALRANGPALGRAAAAAATPQCHAPKIFLDLIDGRTTWEGRENAERHTGDCLRCLDHFCRIHEAVDWLRNTRPLIEAEAAPYLRSLGIEAARPSFFKRLLRA